MDRDDPRAADTALPPPEKEVIRLPDGRELTYYPFPGSAATKPTAAPARPAPRKER